MKILKSQLKQLVEEVINEDKYVSAGLTKSDQHGYYAYEYTSHDGRAFYPVMMSNRVSTKTINAIAALLDKD